MLEVKLLSKGTKVHTNEIVTRDVYDIAGYTLKAVTSISKIDGAVITYYSINEPVNSSMPLILIDLNDDTNKYDIRLSSYSCMFNFDEMDEQIKKLTTAKEVVETIKATFNI